MKLNKKIFSYFNKHGATILSIAAAAGVVLTAVETAKATTKAQSLIDMNKAEPMTKKEIVKDCWKFYVPAAVVGVGTIACILGSNSLNKKTQAELMAAYVAVQQTYSTYRKKVAEQVGEETEKDIHRQVETMPRADNGDVEHADIGNRTGQWFWSMIVSLGLASMDDNRFHQSRAEFVIERFRRRDYQPNGAGGLFTLQNPKEDLRTLDIWYQMMAYLNENDI